MSSTSKFSHLHPPIVTNFKYLHQLVTNITLAVCIFAPQLPWRRQHQFSVTIFRGLIYWNLGQWSCWHILLIMPNPFWIFMLVHEFWVICIKYIIYFYILLASFWASQVRKRVVIFSDSSSKLNLLPFRKLTIMLYNENNHMGPPNRCQSYAA